jgi:hypothetical protein
VTQQQIAAQEQIPVPELVAVLATAVAVPANVVPANVVPANSVPANAVPPNGAVSTPAAETASGTMPQPKAATPAQEMSAPQPEPAPAPAGQPAETALLQGIGTPEEAEPAAPLPPENGAQHSPGQLAASPAPESPRPAAVPLLLLPAAAAALPAAANLAVPNHNPIAVPMMPPIAFVPPAPFSTKTLDRPAPERRRHDSLNRLLRKAAGKRLAEEIRRYGSRGRGKAVEHTASSVRLRYVDASGTVRGVVAHLGHGGAHPFPLDTIHTAAIVYPDWGDASRYRLVFGSHRAALLREEVTADHW